MATSVLKVAGNSIGPAESLIRVAISKLADAPVNVSQPERWASLAIGSGLIVKGLLGRRLNLLSLMSGGALLWRGVSGNCRLYQALGMNTAKDNDAAVISAGEGVRVETAITIDRPAHDLYLFWHDLKRIPEVMRHVREIRPINDRRSHWVIEGPVGSTVEWDAEIIKDESDKVISWKSIEGADVDTAGSVHFRPSPAGHGTEVRVNFKYDPPAGRLGVAFNKVLGNDPAEQLRQDLQALKQMMEKENQTDPPTS